VSIIALRGRELEGSGTVGGDPFGGFLDGFHAFHAHEADGEVAGDGEGVRTVSGPCLVVVFPVGRVADVVAFILYSPVVSRVPVDVGRRCFRVWAAGDQEGDRLAHALA